MLLVSPGGGRDDLSRSRGHHPDTDQNPSAAAAITPVSAA